MAGKTSTRQKMINMMYLVFIAMLALNLSKEVLATLGILNDDLESSIVELESSSKIHYDQISSNSDNLDYKIDAEMVGNMKNVSDDFYNFIQNIKDSLISSDEHSYLKDIGRAEYGSVTDAEALDALKLVSELEGIIPALEPAHALHITGVLASKRKGQIIIMNMCGRGDKDLTSVLPLIINKEN